TADLPQRPLHGGQELPDERRAETEGDENQAEPQHKGQARQQHRLAGRRGRTPAGHGHTVAGQEADIGGHQGQYARGDKGYEAAGESQAVAHRVGQFRIHGIRSLPPWTWPPRVHSPARWSSRAMMKPTPATARDAGRPARAPAGSRARISKIKPDQAAAPCRLMRLRCRSGPSFSQAACHWPRKRTCTLWSPKGRSQTGPDSSWGSRVSSVRPSTRTQSFFRAMTVRRTTAAMPRAAPPRAAANSRIQISACRCATPRIFNDYCTEGGRHAPQAPALGGLGPATV